MNAAARGDTIGSRGAADVACSTTTSTKDLDRHRRGPARSSPRRRERHHRSSSTGDGATLSDPTITSDTRQGAEFVPDRRRRRHRSPATRSTGRTGAADERLGREPRIRHAGRYQRLHRRPTTRSTRCAPGRTSLPEREPATIADNTLYDTKGDFLIDNANFTFTRQPGRRPLAAQRVELRDLREHGRRDRYAERRGAERGQQPHDGVGPAHRSRTTSSPTTADDCKDGGWKDLRPWVPQPGSVLKFVNTGK